MTTIYDVDPNELIEKAAIELKKLKEFEQPEFASYVKTGAHKQRPPMNPDWWQIRVASVLRTIYKQGPVGVSKLRTKYGGKVNRGVKRERFYKGSGSILRKALQQLEKAGFVKQGSRGLHKGRVITPKGKSFLDKLSDQIAGIKPIKESKPAAEIKEAKAEKAESKKGQKEDKKEARKKSEEKKQEAKGSAPDKDAETQTDATSEKSGMQPLKNG